MKILFFGDVFGKPGREALERVAPRWQKEYAPDFMGLNAENIAHGKGITQKTIHAMQELGFDFFTGGNHIFENSNGRELLQDDSYAIIRPFNYPTHIPGKGWRIIKKNDYSLVVGNLMGQVFTRADGTDNPFRAVEQFLHETRQYPIKFLDFHAETTSEKITMAHFIDGRVSALVGTHTHVPTADERITPRRMAYITDVGMCGPLDSVIGLDKDVALSRFLEVGENTTFVVAECRKAEVNAVLIDINDNAQAESIVRLREIVTLG